MLEKENQTNITNDSDSAEEKNVVEITVNDNNAEKFVEAKEKTKLNGWRVFWTWPRLLFALRKAKKMSKKMTVDPNFYSEEYRYNWIKKIAKYCLFLTNIKIEVIDIENWLDRGVVLAPNHESNFDPVFLFAINNFQKQQPLAFIAKQELWKSKLFSRFIKLVDAIPLDRESSRSALDAFKAGKELITEYKRSLVVFPSGTRTGSNELGEWQGAALKVAQMAYAPVIPVTIIDSYKTFSHKGRLTVRVIFGKPFMPEKHMSIKADMLTQNVKKEVQKNMDKYLNMDPKTVKKVVEKPKPKKKKGLIY
ncbi:lysophospholipid acyltransferase family protein [Spiroplasma endosymbiont of Labia minor]|uniref:lysophospholipid acyltransferase family protein n=1 Tax=Spiroplasma endosymbiont of Labia minor TaxID=3066305 RepID=UPI0030D36A87